VAATPAKNQGYTSYNRSVTDIKNLFLPAKLGGIGSAVFSSSALLYMSDFL
jgi:hypothetical protein